MKEFILKYKKNAGLVAAALFALASVGILIYYIVGPSAAFLHADCTDTILWAKASVDSKSLFDPDFGYAALLPFGGTTVMMPLVAIFGYTLKAQQAGMVIFTLLFLLSAWFLCRSLDFSHGYSLFITGALGLVLAASTKLREIFYEHVIYYSICAAAIFLLLGLSLRAMKKKAPAVCIGAVIVASALFALDGMQVIVTGIFPVAFAVCAQLLLKERKIFSFENIFDILTVLGIAAGTGFGFAVVYKLSLNISAGYANAYSTFSPMNEWVQNLLKFPEHWFSLFGVDTLQGQPMFSADSLINIIRIGSAIVIAALPFAALFLYKKLGTGARMITLAHFGLAAVIMFGYVFGILSAANWRLSPLICTGLFTCAALLYEMRTALVPKRLSAAFCIMLIVLCGISSKVILSFPKNGAENNPLFNITQYLEKNGLTKGYATFWNSQVITLLSDSKVQTANIDVNENGIAPCLYQTDKKMFDPVDGIDKYFVLLTQTEFAALSQTDDFEKFGELTRSILYPGDEFVVFLFDSPEVLN